MPMALGGGYCEAMDSGEVLLRLRSADLNMAGISGIDMMKTHPPVIVITGRDELGNKDRLLSLISASA